MIANAVIRPRPAARPSRPSTKFIALTIATVSASVSRIDDDLVEHDGADAAERDVQHAPRHAHRDEHAGRGDLAGELGQRVQAPLVVDQADGHDQSACHDDGGQARRVDEATGEGGQLGGEQHGRQHADIHRQAAHPRRRLQMHVAFPGIGHRADPGGQHANPSRREVGDDRRGQADQRELAQRDACASIGERKQPTGHLLHFAHHWMNRTGRNVRATAAASSSRGQAIGVDAKHFRDGVGGHRARREGCADARR